MILLFALGVLFGPLVTVLASGLRCGLTSKSDPLKLSFSQFPVLT